MKVLRHDHTTGKVQALDIDVERVSPSLDVLRAEAEMPREYFAVLAAQQGWITEAEALAWAVGNAIPAWVEAAIDAAVSTGDALRIKIDVLKNPVVRRLGSLIPVFQAALADRGTTVTDADLDGYFGIKAPVEQP